MRGWLNPVTIRMNDYRNYSNHRKRQQKKLARAVAIFIAVLLFTSIAFAQNKFVIEPDDSGSILQDPLPTYSIEWTETPVEIKAEPVKVVKKPTTPQIYPVPEDEAKAFIYQHESGNDPYAVNPKSGAGGLCQALPFKKMGCELGDYTCQDNWCERYMKERYGTWNAAVTFWLRTDPRPYSGHWW